MIKQRIFYVVNVDWFFLSHRLPLALAMKKKGFEVFVLSKNTGRKCEIESHGLRFLDIDFERSGKNFLKEIAVIRELVKQYMRYRPQFIHHVTIKPAIYGSIAKRFSSAKETKVINAISGLGYNFTDNRNGILQKFLKKMMIFAFKDVNFIFQNPDDMALYEGMGFLKDGNHRLIKGAGVDSNLFSFSSPIAKDRISIVLTARMLYDKGVMEFIEAANILYEKWGDKALFRLVGDIDHDNPAAILEADLINNLRENYIIWTGHTKDVKPVLRDADIVCLPSYREGLPKSLIEAMSIGRPIVTTDVPGCRECVDDNVNGILVQVKNAYALSQALDRLLNDSELRAKMGEASRNKMLAELSLDRVINDTLSFYETI